jgi:hypothetical protein
MIEAKRGANKMTKKDYVLIARAINKSFMMNDGVTREYDNALIEFVKAFRESIRKLDPKFKSKEFEEIAFKLK